MHPKDILHKRRIDRKISQSSTRIEDQIDRQAVVQTDRNHYFTVSRINFEIRPAGFGFRMACDRQHRNATTYYPENYKRPIHHETNGQATKNTTYSSSVRLEPQETFCLIFRIFFIQQLLCIVYVRSSARHRRKPFSTRLLCQTDNLFPIVNQPVDQTAHRFEIETESDTVAQQFAAQFVTVAGPDRLHLPGAIALRAYRA